MTEELVTSEVPVPSPGVEEQIDSLSLSVGEIGEKLDAVTDNLDSLPTVLASSSPDQIDYSTSIEQLRELLDHTQQLLAYTDLLLVVLAVFLVFGFGIVLGSFLLSHFRE